MDNRSRGRPSNPPAGARGSSSNSSNGSGPPHAEGTVPNDTTIQVHIWLVASNTATPQQRQDFEHQLRQNANFLAHVLHHVEQYDPRSRESQRLRAVLARLFLEGGLPLPLPLPPQPLQLPLQPLTVAAVVGAATGGGGGGRGGDIAMVDVSSGAGSAGHGDCGPDLTRTPPEKRGVGGGGGHGEDMAAAQWREGAMRHGEPPWKRVRKR